MYIYVLLTECGLLRYICDIYAAGMLGGLGWVLLIFRGHGWQIPEASRFLEFIFLRLFNIGNGSTLKTVTDVLSSVTALN